MTELNRREILKAAAALPLAAYAPVADYEQIPVEDASANFQIPEGLLAPPAQPEPKRNWDDYFVSLIPWLLRNRELRLCYARPPIDNLERGNLQQEIFYPLSFRTYISASGCDNVANATTMFQPSPWSPVHPNQYEWVKFPLDLLDQIIAADLTTVTQRFPLPGTTSQKFPWTGNDQLVSESFGFVLHLPERSSLLTHLNFLPWLSAFGREEELSASLCPVRFYTGSIGMHLDLLCLANYGRLACELLPTISLSDMLLKQDEFNLKYATWLRQSAVTDYERRVARYGYSRSQGRQVIVDLELLKKIEDSRQSPTDLLRIP